MDISLFSEIVKNLILDNDEVTLPGVGSFVSEIVPSSFSDKGYTINPPYRKLSFRNRIGNDNLLVEFYSRANGTDLESAGTVIKGYLEELKETLMTKKTLEMPGLGRLRSTREGTIFFIPDEDLDIYCSGFGLQPVSLKTHEETPEEVSKAVSDLRRMVDIPNEVPEPAGEPLPEPQAVQEAPPAVTPRQGTEMAEHRKSRFPLWAAAVIFMAILAFCGFILLSRVLPGSVDRFMYSEDELRIIEQYEQFRQ